jgi:hypothetical protein
MQLDPGLDIFATIEKKTCWQLPVESTVLQSRSQGAEIKLPPGAGAGAEITNCGSSSSIPIYQRLTEILKRSWSLQKFLDPYS